MRLLVFVCVLSTKVCATQSTSSLHQAAEMINRVDSITRSRLAIDISTFLKEDKDAYMLLDDPEYLKYLKTYSIQIRDKLFKNYESRYNGRVLGFLELPQFMKDTLVAKDMKKIMLPLILSACTLVGACAQQTYVLQQKQQAPLELKLNIDKAFPVGVATIPAEIILIGLHKITVHDLETGKLEFALRQKLFSGELKDYYRYRGGAYISYSSTGENGIIEFNSERAKQNKVTLKKNDLIKDTVNLTTLFSFLRLTPASYSLSVMFDSMVVATKDFQIFFSYKATIPLLLQSFAVQKKVSESGVGFFYSLTGFPSWARYYFDNDTILTTEVLPQLTEWWKNNGDDILRVESQLNLPGNENLNYAETIPKLIDTIQSGNFSERLQARNRLYSVLGVPSWKPKSDDTTETITREVIKVKDWWRAKSETLIWVNRVILENRNSQH